MDSRDTCSLKDKNKMDPNTVWQWRIIHVRKYLSCLKSFHYSSEIGLDFNVGSSAQKKLDLQLLTNGVILEVCDVAEMINKSKRHFIINILQNNFDLGLENEQERMDFTARILHKVKELISQPPEDKHEVFTLFDASSKPECTSSSKNEQNLASTEHNIDSFLAEVDDTDDTEHEDKWYSKVPYMNGPHADDSECENELECSRPQSTEGLKEDVLPSSFPYCEEIGLNLDVGAKQSLDPGLLTKGVMLEIVHFTRVLTSYSSVVLDVLGHNFDLDLKSDQGKKVLDLVKRRERLLAEFNSEPCTFQKNTGMAQQYEFKEVTKRWQSDLKPKQEKRALSSTSERITKRCRREQSEQEETNTVSDDSVLNASQTAEDDNGCTSSLDSYKATDSENAENVDWLQNPSSDIPRESESGCLGVRMPFLTTFDGLSSLPIVNSNMNTSFADQADERVVGGDEEQIQSPRNVLNECHMGQEEMETERNMWKLRANRVRQILLLKKEYSSQKWSHKCSLEFNVGFGPKQNISVEFLSNTDLIEVARFALAMNSSQQDFIMEILEYNFDFGLQSKSHRQTFVDEVMNRVRRLKNSDDAVKFSREVFDLPCPVSSFNVTNQSKRTVDPELGSISGIEKCDVASVCPPDSHARAKEPTDLYPFCKDIGLKLHVNHNQANKKLELSKLTNGAMTEVTNFAEKLCGTFEQICLDVLRHNFDFQSRDSDFATNIISQIPVIMDQRNWSIRLLSKKPKHRVSVLGTQDCQINPSLEACSTSSYQAPIVDQNVGSSTDSQPEDELSLFLWKLRANQVQQILSVPHGEDCPLYSYSRCKKAGIDFNVGSGVKQNLDSKLLTNGIMVELYTFATALQSAQKEFITDILEYNFELNLKNELYRSVFAFKIFKKCKQAVSYTKDRLLNMPFGLPDLGCIEESTYPKSKKCPKCYQVRKSKLCMDEPDPGHVRHPHPNAKSDALSAEANCTAQKPATDPTSTFLATEKKIMNCYHRCKKIGLSLSVDKDQPKGKLSTEFLTRGIVKEVTCLAKKLCGTKLNIIIDILKHNFCILLQNQDINPARLFSIVVAVKGVAPAWFNEIFVIKPHSLRNPGDAGKLRKISAMQKSERKEAAKQRQLALQTKKESCTLQSHYMEQENRALSVTTKCFAKRCRREQPEQEETNTVSHDGVLCTCETAEDDYGYMCPLDSDEAEDSENAENEDQLQNPSFDIPRESESGCLGVRMPFLTTFDGLSSLPIVNSSMNTSFADQADERVVGGDEEQIQSPRNVLNECHMGQEEMETESNMWKLRANRVRQILLLKKEYCKFNWSHKCSLEFNVGFGPKQNISVDFLSNAILIEVAKFALAMNSSQQDFIMEILEYNFDFGLRSKSHRQTFADEVTNRVRRLKNSDDTVKFSREVFDLPCPVSLFNVTSQSKRTVDPELGSISGIEKCDTASVCPPDSHARAKEPTDLYPFCKDIGLKLHVNHNQANKKLELSKLTNGAMTEVTNFAEKLCGTFEQICLDVLRHNFDFQSRDSDFAGNIIEQIPMILQKSHLSSCISFCTNKQKFLLEKQDCQINPSLEACSTSSYQAPVVDQTVGSSTDSQPEDELNLFLWKLRANQVQQILSVPHGEDCPLYSYSRCKKAGIDFNVGSGVKQNLDPKLLTNGIMVELHTFALALQSARKEFITDILEYNFELNLKNELCRSVFAQQIGDRLLARSCKRNFYRKMPFDLPDLRYLEKGTYPKAKYCPKCYQDRHSKLCQDESRMLYPYPHVKTDTVSAEANCTAQSPANGLSLASTATDEIIMNRYSCCKKIGLSLCVHKDQPKEKLDTNVLTREIMFEVAHFAKNLCGAKWKILNDLVKHNFNFGMQNQDNVNTTALFTRAVMRPYKEPTWFDEIFVVQPCSHSHPKQNVTKRKKLSAALQKSELKERTKKRQLAMQTKKESTSLPSDNVSAVKPKKKSQFPLCKKIGLSLGLASKARAKEKLDLRLLTRAVMMEIYKFSTKSGTPCFTSTVYDILDYNFDLSSQHDRQRKFALEIASKVKGMVKDYRRNIHRVDEVFKLPFVFQRKSAEGLVPKSPSIHPLSHTPERSAVRHRADTQRQTTTHTQAHSYGQFRVTKQPKLLVSGLWEDVPKSQNKERSQSFLEEPVKTTNESQFARPVIKSEPWSDDEEHGFLIEQDAHYSLQEKIQTMKEECNPYYGNMEPELESEEKYHPNCENAKLETNIKHVEYLVPGEPAGPLGHMTTCQTSENNLKRESETRDGHYSILAEPQASVGYDTVCPHTWSSMPTELDAEHVEHVVPAETAGSQEFSMITVSWNTEGAQIKEEQEYVPDESYTYETILNTESEAGIYQDLNQWFS